MALHLVTIGSRKNSKESINFKVDVLALKVAGKTDKEAIVQAAEKHGKELKPSYLSHPGSHVYRFKKEINALLEKEDPMTIGACQIRNLIVYPDPVPQEFPEADETENN